MIDRIQTLFFQREEIWYAELFLLHDEECLAVIQFQNDQQQVAREWMICTQEQLLAATFRKKDVTNGLSGDSLSPERAAGD